MATWAIGDIHGCFDELQALVERIGFDPARDRLWFVGDFVNRGPRSADTVRWVRDLGDHARCVLGNHDLHLLATAAGIRCKPGKDRFDDILGAPDRDELLDWLRTRPLLHHDADLGFTLVHAGLHPHWDLATAQRLAREIEEELRGPEPARMLAYMYGDGPVHWSPHLETEARHRFAINVFTRMRYCRADGEVDLDWTGPPGSQARGLMPWFDVPGRANADLQIIFGHWSTLGYARRNGVYALDSGCLWGGSLTALSLDDPATVIQHDCPCTK